MVSNVRLDMARECWTRMYLEEISNRTPNIGHDLFGLLKPDGGQDLLEMCHAGQKGVYPIHVHHCLCYLSLRLNGIYVLLHSFVAARLEEFLVLGL